MMNALDADQRACVEMFAEAIERRSTIVIRAGAGSGKSHTIVCAMGMYANALGISHTRVACENLRERLGKDDVDIYTIHAIANRLTSNEDQDAQHPESGKDFDKMLRHAIDFLIDPDATLPEWLASRRYIVIDEFQDTGEDQNMFVNLLRTRLGCALAVVGDFAQGIYGFQGASPMHMNNLRMQSDCTDLLLPNNYRSHPAIVEHANRLAHLSNGGIKGAVQMRALRLPRPGTRTCALHLRCYRGDVDLVQGIVLWIRNRYGRGILHEGDVLTLFPSQRFATDYAGRRFRLTGSDSSPTHDGLALILKSKRVAEGAPLPVGDIVLSDYTDIAECARMVVHNRPRRLLVACRKVADRRQILNQVYNSLITKEGIDPARIFITDRDNKPESRDDKHLVRNAEISLTTIHGAKGEEWDSVLHVDLGEDLRRPQCEDEEEQRILYVSHTRAVDELWHVASIKDANSSLTRYMTHELVTFFSHQPETWEAMGPKAVQPRLFELTTPLGPPELKSERLSVTKVAQSTKTVWEPSDTRPSIQEIVWKHTPGIPRLPKDLYVLNAAHGLLCEWICLWHMHEGATRHNLAMFLYTILRKYSVNRVFASAMELVFAYGSPDEHRLVRHEFDALFLNTTKPVDRIFELITSAIGRMSCDVKDDCAGGRLTIGDVRTGMNNARKQRNVSIVPAVDACPVRPTIRHFDSHSGNDSWKLDDLPGAKQRAIDACRSVLRFNGGAALRDKFVCLMFMESVGMEQDEMCQMNTNEQGWRVLLRVLRDTELLSSYIEYMETHITMLHSDAIAVRESTGVTEYQQTVHGAFGVESIATDERAEYILQGSADATSTDAVLEVTSRDANYHMKVQQAHIYATLLNKPRVYNYYIEERLLVVRTRTEEANAFLMRSAEEYIVKHGLPGTREAICRASLFADWTIQSTAMGVELETPDAME